MANHIQYGSTGKPHPYHLVRPSIWPLMSLSAACSRLAWSCICMKRKSAGSLSGLKARL